MSAAESKFILSTREHEILPAASKMDYPLKYKAQKRKEEPNKTPGDALLMDMGGCERLGGFLRSQTALKTDDKPENVCVRARREYFEQNRGKYERNERDFAATGANEITVEYPTLVPIQNESLDFIMKMHGGQ